VVQYPHGLASKPSLDEELHATRGAVAAIESDLEELGHIREQLTASVTEPVEWPHPSVIFDLEDRVGNPLRIFKAIAQNTQLHSEHFWAATQRSHLAILDAYLGAVSRRELIVAQSMARAMLEMNGLLHQVQSLLNGITLKVDESNWQSMGQSFWSKIVRARLGTSDPSLHDPLLAAGVAEASLKPFGVTYCIHMLATETGFEDVESRYATLCDSVHQNAGSRVSAVGGIRNGNRGQLGAGEWVIPGGPVPILRYEYPGASDLLYAHIARTAGGMLVDTKACLTWANQTPASPFSMEMAERITGNPFGGGNGPK
jgi:hypothetical protein